MHGENGDSLQYKFRESLASDEVLNIREKDKSFGGGNA